MARYDFKEDLDVGEDGEKIVIRDLEMLGCKFIGDNKDNKFDIEMEIPKRVTKYEIKTDVFCEPHTDNGNMFIEFECRGKKSGIEVTQAEWFVTYFKYLREIWYIKTDDLLTLIKESNFPVSKFSGDINSNTKGYLLPRYAYKDDFIIRKVPKECQN